MAKRWYYSQADGHSVGDMICTSCRQEIVSGQFRYRETEAAYLPQHRSCCPDDPEWGNIEKRLLEQKAFFARRKAALQAFIDQYGAPDEDLIDECMAERGRPVVGDVRQPEERT